MTIVPSLLFELWSLDQGSRPSSDGNFGSFEETGAYLTGGAVGTGTGRGQRKLPPATASRALPSSLSPPSFSSQYYTLVCCPSSSSASSSCGCHCLRRTKRLVAAVRPPSAITSVLLDSPVSVLLYPGRPWCSVVVQLQVRRSFLLR